MVVIFSKKYDVREDGEMKFHFTTSKQHENRTHITKNCKTLKEHELFSSLIKKHHFKSQMNNDEKNNKATRHVRISSRDYQEHLQICCFHFATKHGISSEKFRYNLTTDLGVLSLGLLNDSRHEYDHIISFKG